jgi:alpha-L-fucosidase 2
MKSSSFRTLLTLAVTLTSAACGWGADCSDRASMDDAAPSTAARIHAAEIIFDHPAADLVNEGLPIGNGRMGMLVQGGIDRESDAICEDSMWSGWQNANADNAEAAKYLPEIRRLLAEGKISEAQDLINKTQISRKDDGKGNNTYDAYGTYEMLARLEIETGQDAAKATDYERDLSMLFGRVRTGYEIDGGRYRRDYFCSRPDEVQVIRFSASVRGKISFSATLARPDTNATVTADGENAILLSGYMPVRNGEKGLKYVCRLGAKHTGGRAENMDGKLVFTDCDEVILYITAGTNYKGLRFWPDYLDGGEACLTKTQKQLETAESKDWATLFKRHFEDMQKLFSRVNLSIPVSALPYNFSCKPALLQKARSGDIAPALLSAYFQYGRYLLISSSREGGLPANLQGLWTVNFKDEKTGKWNYYTPWNGDYHANVNVQMNYWPAYSANLAECAGPLTDLIEALPGPGAVTARVQHGCDGWTTHTMNNVWGFTSPGWEASWGHFPMAGPWLATHLWTGYAYTLDKTYLRKAWPTLKGSAEFLLSWLTLDKDGKLVSGPSESPENRFTLPDGTTGYFCMGPSMDQELSAQVFEETLRAAKVLGIDDDFTKKCAAALALIRPVGIGPDGRLLEWTEQYDEPEPGHRHTSHLFGLYPGTTISVEKTPELAKAARKSLEYRTAHGGGYTGWSRAMMSGEWARLHDGDKAYENLVALLKDSTLPNLFDSCPPFQIDGNFGATAAIIEMLMQSRYEADGTTTIELLPALPHAWPAGQITGIVAQGNVVVDITWVNGALESAGLTARQDIDARILCSGKSATFSLKKGVTLALDASLQPIAKAPVK